MTLLRLLPVESSPTLDDLFYMLGAPGTVPVDRQVNGTAVATMLAADTAFTGRYLSILAPSGDATGATDVANFNTATAAASAAGGGAVVLGGGVFYFNARPDVPSNVTIRGMGWSTILRATSANTGANSGLLRLRGLTNITVRDLALDGAGFATTSILIQLPNTADVAVDHTVHHCHFSGDVGHACLGYNAVVGYRFTVNTIASSVYGTSIQVPTGTTSRTIELSRNVVSNITGTNGCGLGLRSFGGSERDQFYDVSVCDNKLDLVGADSIPIELTGCNGGAVKGNIIRPSTRGVSTGACTDMVISTNVFDGQTIYAVEMNNGIRMKVAFNIALDCAKFCSENAVGIALSVIGNTIVGTGLVSGTGDYRTIVVYAADGVLIATNDFHGLEYADNVIHLGFVAACDNATVRTNDFYVDTTNAPLECIRVARGTDVTVEVNKIVVSRDLVAGDNNRQVIRLDMGTTVVGAAVLRNEVVFTGDIAASTTATGIGTDNAAAAALARSRMVGNRVHNAPYGFGASTTSADFIFEDNDGRTCVVESSINAAVIYRRTLRDYEGTAAPTAGTWVAGDRVWNTAPAGGGVPGWICTAGGTPGTWKAMAVLAA